MTMGGKQEACSIPITEFLSFDLELLRLQQFVRQGRKHEVKVV